MNDFKISVIIPTYNRKNWIQFALDSVRRQTFPAFEIIVIDDGSTDGTEKFIEKLYPEVRYFWQKNQGPAATRNRGAEKAAGNWLAFLDSDDRWLPEKLEKQVKFLLEHQQYLIVYTNEIWIRGGQRVNPKKRHQKFGGWIYPYCLPLCIISPSSVLLAREIWEEFSGFDETLPACEDYELWLRITAKYPVGFQNEPLILKYGGHQDQLSRQWGLDRFRVYALEKMLRQRNLQEEWARLTRDELIRRCKILELGFRKHGRVLAADEFAKKAAEWQSAFLHSSQPDP